MSQPRPLTRRSMLLALSTGLLAPALITVTTTDGAAADGDTAWTSGLNSDGQLGNGTTNSRSSFARAGSLSDIDEVTGGREHVVARVDGTVWTWGDGSKGATGLGTLADRPNPTQVPGLTGVTNVSAGHYHSLALLSNGTVRGWGFNALGQLGDRTTTRRTSPVTVQTANGAALSNVSDIVGGRDMSYAVLSNGAVRSWGGGANGELGNGTTTQRQTSAVAVEGLPGPVTEMAVGRNHALALLADGRVFAWGLNTSGQLGDDSRVTRTRPVLVRGLANVVGIAAGADHSVAVRQDGRVLTWGEGSRGQLGSGGTADRLRPALVNGLRLVASVGCGRDHTLAIGRDGSVRAWGQNDYGQLGDGTTNRRLAPVVVPGISNAVSAHGGRGYTVLLRNT